MENTTLYKNYILYDHDVLIDCKWDREMFAHDDELDINIDVYERAIESAIRAEFPAIESVIFLNDSILMNVMAPEGMQDEIAEIINGLPIPDACYTPNVKVHLEKLCEEMTLEEFTSCCNKLQRM